MAPGESAHLQYSIGRQANEYSACVQENIQNAGVASRNQNLDRLVQHPEACGGKKDYQQALASIDATRFEDVKPQDREYPELRDVQKILNRGAQLEEQLHISDGAVHWNQRSCKNRQSVKRREAKKMLLEGRRATAFDV
jgi:predicted transcriptional regulator of viral defense system